MKSDDKLGNGRARVLETSELRWSSWTRLLSVLLVAVSAGGCASISAPYQFTGQADGGIARPEKTPNQLILPPGTQVDHSHIRLLVEREEVSAGCRALPAIQTSTFTMSVLKWEEIGKQAFRIDVDRAKAQCGPNEVTKLRGCLVANVLPHIDAALAAAAANPSVRSCLPDRAEFRSALKASFPYHARESLQDDMGFRFENDDKPDSKPELASVSVFPGLKVCIRSEMALGTSYENNSRVIGGDQCQQFLKAEDGKLAFPRLDHYASPAIPGQAFPTQAAAIFESQTWSAIRSHAAHSFDNAFRLSIYFPREQRVTQTWEPASEFMRKIATPSDTSAAGPLVVMDSAVIDLPSRKMPMSQLCAGQRSCYIFRDRPVVRLTQPIWLDAYMLEMELGTTFADAQTLVALSSSQLNLMRKYREKSVTVKGDAGPIPLVPGDTLRRIP